MMVIVDPAGGPGAVAGAVVSRPALLERLSGPAQVTVVAAPAGSGKTVLLRSWLSRQELGGRAALMPAGRGERDPQRFWVSVADALRQTAGGRGWRGRRQPRRTWTRGAWWSGC
jgi:LuxR family transcriptional regulator, maltose regulon positive regulatory protein